MSRSRLAALAALLPTPAGLDAAVVDEQISFGAAAVDVRLGGGLAVAGIHEFYASSAADAPALAAIGLLLALRNGRSGPIVWVEEDRARAEGRLYGLGLVDLGIDPARLLLVEAPDTLGVLRAGADAVACDAVAAVILAPHGKAAALDLTATRRLALAATRSGVTVLALRQGEPTPSAALSRWQVAAAPSSRLPGGASGLPVFRLDLLRHRGGITGFSCLLEWDRDHQAFAEAHSGAVLAAAFERAGAAPERPHVSNRRAA